MSNWPRPFVGIVPSHPARVPPNLGTGGKLEVPTGGSNTAPSVVTTPPANRALRFTPGGLTALRTADLLASEKFEARDLTVAALVKFNAVGIRQMVATMDSSSPRFWYLQVGASNAVDFAAYDGLGGTNLTTTGTIGTTRPHFLGARLRHFQDKTVWLDDERVLSAANETDIQDATGGIPLWISGRGRGASGEHFLNADLLGLWVWPGWAASDEQMEALRHDIFAPLRRPITVVPFGAEEAGGADIISVPFLSSGEQVYDPTVVAADLVSVGFLASGETPYAPTVIEADIVSVGFVASQEVAHVPTVTTTANTVAPGFLASGETLYAPTVTEADVVAPGFLSSTQVAYQPTVTATPNTVSVGYLASAQATYAPTVLEADIVAPAFLASGEVSYTPTVQAGVAGTTISVGFLASAETAYQPTVTPGAITVSPPFVVSGQVAYAPTIVEGQTVTVGFLGTSEATYAPTVVATVVTVAPGFLASQEAIFSPTVTVGSGIVVPFVSTTETAYPPSLVPGSFTLSPPFLSSGETIYNPQVGSFLPITVDVVARESVTIALSARSSLTLDLTVNPEV